MASTLRLPVAASHNVTRPCLTVSSQHRSFSQSSQQWAAGGRAVNFRPPSVAQPSFKTRTQGMKLADLPNDIGMLPGTFVRPLWSDMPSIFSAPKDRLHMEWTWLKSLFGNYTSLLQYCKRGNDLPLLLTERRQYALNLHKTMCTAFAEGDVPGIKRITCDTFAKNLVRQIERRPKNESMSWKLLKYLRTSSTNFLGVRVLSDRATVIPDIPKSGIRQLVVRITSRQSTTTTNTEIKGKTADEASSPSKEKDCLEYVVIQNMRWNGQDKGWRVWGFINPTTLEATRTDPHFMPKLTAMERLRMIQDSLTRR